MPRPRCGRSPRRRSTRSTTSTPSGSRRSRRTRRRAIGTASSRCLRSSRRAARRRRFLPVATFAPRARTPSPRRRRGSGEGLRLVRREHLAPLEGLAAQHRCGVLRSPRAANRCDAPDFRRNRARSAVAPKGARGRAPRREARRSPSPRSAACACLRHRQAEEPKLRRLVLHPLSPEWSASADGSLRAFFQCSRSRDWLLRSALTSASALSGQLSRATSSFAASRRQSTSSTCRHAVASRRGRRASDERGSAEPRRFRRRGRRQCSATILSKHCISTVLVARAGKQPARVAPAADFSGEVVTERGFREPHQRAQALEALSRLVDRLVAARLLARQGGARLGDLLLRHAAEGMAKVLPRLEPPGHPYASPAARRPPTSDRAASQDARRSSAPPR